MTCFIIIARIISLSHN